MNRIRKVDNGYQVLITPDIKVSPDSALLIGNWTDENLRNYYLLHFHSLNDAQCAAYDYPDIDWYRIVLNHKYIFLRLKDTIQTILKNNNLNVELQSVLMEPEMLKEVIFERVARGGDRFNLRYGMNDVISFTIVNPWSNNLHTIAKLIENHREHLYRDDLRIRYKKIVDGKIICLYGATEFGTIYEIRLIPTLLQQWGEWYNKVGYKNGRNADDLYNKYLKQQNEIDLMQGVI